jgi:hypothetical protein
MTDSLDGKWRSWTAAEKVMSALLLVFATVVLVFAFVDPSVRGVAGAFKVGGMLAFLVGSALSPSMFFMPFNALRTPPRPALMGLFGFLVLSGMGSLIDLVHPLLVGH